MKYLELHSEYMEVMKKHEWIRRETKKHQDNLKEFKNRFNSFKKEVRKRVKEQDKPNRKVGGR